MQPLAAEPLIECRDAAAVTLQQIAAIHLRRLTHGVNRAGGHERIEAAGVDIDGSGTKTDRVAVADEQIRWKKAQCRAKLASQTGHIIMLEERSEILERRWRVSMQSQPDDKGLRSAASHRQAVASLIGRRESAEEADSEDWHRKLG